MKINLKSSKHASLCIVWITHSNCITHLPSLKEIEREPRAVDEMYVSPVLTISQCGGNRGGNLEAFCCCVKTKGKYLTHWPLIDVAVIWKVSFSNSSYRIVAWALTLALLSKFTNENSTLVHVMAWCLMAPSHYLNQCWPRSISPYGVNRPWWVNETWCP